jgi:subtilisin family serine protease
VEVFVMDTGIDSQHDELLGRVAAGQDFTSDVPKTTEGPVATARTGHKDGSLPS